MLYHHSYCYAKNDQFSYDNKNNKTKATQYTLTFMYIELVKSKLITIPILIWKKYKTKANSKDWTLYTNKNTAAIEF